MKLSDAMPFSLEEAAARSGTYRLLARLWLREVDRDLLQKLREPSLGRSFVQAGGIFPASQDDRAVEELAMDYCRLFLGPSDHQPPFQSVWQTGQFHGESAASMKCFVDMLAYDRDSLPRGTMLDHLGVQLDVMGHLLDRAATSHFDAEMLEGVLEIADAFFARHLSWPTDLLVSSARRAQTEFYQAAIMMTGSFLDCERHN